MTLYLQPLEAAPIPGRFQTVWASMTDPVHPSLFSAAQTQLVEEASGTIDDVTGQDGGLLTQTDKTATRRVQESTDTLWLPNKPLTAITRLTVHRAGATFDLDPAGVEYEGSSNFFVYHAWNQAGTIPSGLVAMTFGLDGVYYPFAAGDRVDVTYSCGYAETPAVVRDVCRRILAEMVFSAVENPAGATHIREGSTQGVWGTVSSVNVVDIRTRRALLPFSVNKIR